MNTSKMIGAAVGAVVLIGAAAFSLLQDGCDPTQVAGTYRADGSPPIELSLAAGGRGRLSIGDALRVDDLTWELDTKSGNLFLSLPTQAAEMLRQRGGGQPGPKGNWDRVQFGLEATCTVFAKRLYINREAGVYLIQLRGEGK
jgi:hypothetical protein